MVKLSLILMVVLSGCFSRNLLFHEGNYIPDNPAEEIAETVLEYKTGVDVDLSPGTPEVK